MNELKKMYLHSLHHDNNWPNLNAEMLELNDNTFEGAFLNTEAGVAFFNKMHTNITVSMTTNFYRAPFSMLFRKHSCLTSEVNRLVHIFTESGLLQHWVEAFVDRRYFKPIPPTYHRHMHLNQLLGIVQICLGLFGLAGGIFVLEMLSRRYHHLRLVMDYFTY